MEQVTRRAFGCAVIGSSLSLLGGTSVAHAQSPQGRSQSLPSADSWLQDWKKSNPTKQLEGAFDLRRFKDPIYVLLDPISWTPQPPATTPEAVHVPRGFVTDFASIPRVFWSIFRPDGDYAYAAVIHDYLYWAQTEEHPKLIADEVFRLAMNDLKITDWQSDALFHAVDKFGGGAWENNRNLKAAGEKRIIQILPSDPAVSWEEWKRRPDIY